MISIPSDLNQFLISGARDVRIVAEISGLTNSAGKTILYSNGPIQVSGSDIRPLLTAPESNSSKLSLNESQVTFSSIGFQIIDKDGEITSRLDDFAFKGKTVTFKLGVAGVAYASYITVYVGVIQDISLSDDTLAYDFTTTDAQVNLDKFIFILAETKLTAALTPISTSIPVESTSAFATAGPFSNFESFASARGHLLIGSGDSAEIIRWTAKDATNFTTIDRAQLGTVLGSYAIGVQVREIAIWPGHPLEILKVILTGTALEEDANFANVPTGWKLATTVSIDSTSWTAAKDRTREVLYEYRTLSKQFVRTFAEEEIMIPLKLFLRTTPANALGLVPIIERPIPLSPARKVLRDKVSPIPEWTAGGQEVSNQLIVLFDYDIKIGTFATSRTVNDSTSQAKYGVYGSTTIELKGLRSDNGGVDLADLIGQYHFKVFADLRPTVDLQAFPSEASIEVGDAVRLTHARLPAPSEGARGVADRFLKVIGRDFAFANLSSRWSLFDADIPSANKYGSLPTEAQADYGSATATEQAERVFFDRSFRGA